MEYVVADAAPKALAGNPNPHWASTLGRHLFAFLLLLIRVLLTYTPSQYPFQNGNNNQAPSAIFAIFMTIYCLVIIGTTFKYPCCWPKPGANLFEMNHSYTAYKHMHSAADMEYPCIDVLYHSSVYNNSVVSMVCMTDVFLLITLISTDRMQDFGWMPLIAELILFLLHGVLAIKAWLLYQTEKIQTAKQSLMN